MRKTLAIAFTVLLSLGPSIVFAKGKTTKIVIEGPDLPKPIEITDRNVLANFNVWAGPFIADWSRGPTAHLPQALQKYQVTFYSDERSERPSYVVYYAVAPSSNQGYVYLPGPSDKWWQLNTFSIVRGVEGKWFRVSVAWENVARPLIDKARTASKS